MQLGYQQSLSQITNQASLGLRTNTQSVFSSTLASNASVAFGNVTTAFNNQLNTFINDLNAKRASVNAELQSELANNPSYRGLRSKGVSLAWEYERADVAMGGRGTVEGGWSDSEVQQIKQNGKPRIYDPYYDEIRTPEGHHINNVAGHEEMQADPDNIRFYKSREDHVNKGHHGDVNNPSEGDLIDKNAHLRDTNKVRVIRNELRGVALSAGIGFGLGFALSSIAELAAKGISAVDVGELILHSTATGLETAFISTLGYGAGRLATLGLEKLGFNVLNGFGKTLNFGVVGIAAIAAISLYQYIKLRFNGIERRETSVQVGKQTLFSVSVLCVSMVAQGIYGGYAGIIVSTSIGMLYFCYGVSKMIAQREKAEKLRADTIIAYRDIVFS